MRTDHSLINTNQYFQSNFGDSNVARELCGIYGCNSLLFKELFKVGEKVYDTVIFLPNQKLEKHIRAGHSRAASFVRPNEIYELLHSLRPSHSDLAVYLWCFLPSQ